MIVVGLGVSMVWIWGCGRSTFPWTFVMCHAINGQALASSKGKGLMKQVWVGLLSEGLDKGF